MPTFKDLIGNQPLFVNISDVLKPKTDILKRSVPSVEPIGYKPAVESVINAGPSISQAVQQPVSTFGTPVLKRFGTPTALAFGI